SSEIEHVIVREHAAVDRHDGQAVDVRWMHSIVNALARPESVARRDARLEIDDADVRPLACQLLERFAPDVPGRDASRDTSRNLLGELDVHAGIARSEEHTSELQSRENLVYRLL